MYNDIYKFNVFNNYSVFTNQLNYETPIYAVIQYIQ